MPKVVKGKRKSKNSSAEATSSQYSLRKKSSIDLNPEPSCSQVNLMHAIKEKWSTQEIMDLTEGILTHGHMSKDVLKNLPDKTWSSYTRLFYQVANYVRMQPPATELIENLNNWLERAKDNKKFANGSLDIAVLLKLLSMDGVIENHPAPEMANGVDFGACYRVLHQAVLGYPLQPLNEPTFKLFSELFTDLTKSVDSEREVIERIKKFVHPPDSKVNLENLFVDKVPKNVIKSYSRKKPAAENNVPNPEPKDITGISWEKHQGLKEVLESPCYNPLNFPHELLLKSMLKSDSEVGI